MSSLAIKGAGIIHGAAPTSAATPKVGSPKKGGYGSNVLSPRRYTDDIDTTNQAREIGVANAPGLPSAAAAVKTGL
jgi:hypothetical protein